ncbi:hypothetical protein DPMN_001350 [Dreissena polymorpha]|uniref:Uncharacterized protein n=1 Tax=Dreissena polymorpha TaxID=45954 RepID=A0A9D4MLJ2_DREPO|nr:hypothetical protein DPMN_001350 [Dreissena polymorpha]
MKGKHKFAYIWEEMLFMILTHPDPELPVVEVQKEDGQGRKRLLHRNNLLPFISLPIEDI